MGHTEIPITENIVVKNDHRPINVDPSDLAAFDWPITALASITHRIAGVVLFVGIGFGLFALETSLASEEGFNALKAMIKSPLGMFISCLRRLLTISWQALNTWSWTWALPKH